MVVTAAAAAVVVEDGSATIGLLFATVTVLEGAMAANCDNAICFATASFAACSARAFACSSIRFFVSNVSFIS